MLNDTEALAVYQHTPGYPVLDRTSALLKVRSHGDAGAAIASLDTVVVHATGQRGVVTAVDHDTAQVVVVTDAGKLLTVPGADLVVTVQASFPPLPDDYLEGKTLTEARTEMVPVASDNGRYPQYHARFFDGWVFGRARRNIKHRGELILTRGQRCLVQPDTGPPSVSPPACTAWITRTTGTRRVGRAVGLWSSSIEFEPRDYADVVCDVLNANQRL